MARTRITTESLHRGLARAARPRAPIALGVLLACGSCYLSHAREGEDIPPADTDGDCLTDREERGLDTDPLVVDTDGDGLTDWQEDRCGSDPLDPTNGAAANSTVVVLPYLDPEAEHRTVAITPDIEVADVYFLVDTTGSMDAAIMNVATSLATTIAPAIDATIADVQMGVGHFNDAPRSPYGDLGDQPFWNSVSITDDLPALQEAFDALYLYPTWGSGNDTAESHVLGLYLTATGDSFHDCDAGVPASVCPSVPGEPGPRKGYPCFRPNVLPIVVVVTDAPWHSGPWGEEAYDCTSIAYADAISKLVTLGARVLGVFVDNYGTEGLPALRQAAIDTGAVDSMGEPLVVQVASGAMVSTSIVDMIESLAYEGPQDVTTMALDAAGDPPGAEYDATLFLTGMGTLSASPPDGFSHSDESTFYDVQPETEVSFALSFGNTTVPPGPEPQYFKLWIRFMGNSVSLLDAREFTIVVPPAVPETCAG